MKEDTIPKAVWSGTFTIFGVELKCHVLDDGRRVIDMESMEKLFAAMADGTTDTSNIDKECAAFFRWQADTSWPTTGSRN